MRLFIRGLAAAVALALVGVGAWVTWIVVEYPKVPQPFPITSAAASPQKIARGSYLFRS